MTSVFVFASYVVLSLIFLYPLAIFYGCIARFVSDLAGKPGERFIATRLIYHSTLPTQINEKFTELLDANLVLHLYGYVSIKAQITNHRFGVHLTIFPIRNYKTTDRSRVALLLQFSIFLVLMSDLMLSSPSMCPDNI